MSKKSNEDKIFDKELDIEGIQDKNVQLIYQSDQDEDELQTALGNQDNSISDLRFKWPRNKQIITKKEQVKKQGINFGTQPEKKQQQLKLQQKQNLIQPVQLQFKIEEPDESNIIVQNQGQKKQNKVSTKLKQEVLKQQKGQNEQEEQKFQKEQKIMSKVVQTFSTQNKSDTIYISEGLQQAVQQSPYYENHKLVLTSEIISLNARAKFRIQELKYCVGFGIGLKEVLKNHDYCYKSDNNEMSHGLYIVTSQGYSWSHSQKEEDDIPRQGFNQLYPGAVVDISLIGEQLIFKWKKHDFKMMLPANIREKYTLSFCVYLHEKGDCVIIQ